MTLPACRIVRGRSIAKGRLFFCFVTVMASSSAQGEEWCLLEDDGEEGGSVVFAGAIAEREKKLR